MTKEHDYFDDTVAILRTLDNRGIDGSTIISYLSRIETAIVERRTLLPVYEELKTLEMQSFN